MARTKYKLGTFVKTVETDEQAAHHGAVEEIRLTPAGTSYKLSGLDEAVTEDEIEKGYREITQRKPQARTAKGKTRKSKNAETHAAA